MSDTKSVNPTEKKFVRLETLCSLYDLNLATFRKKAARREFPGIVQRRGERRLYIDVDTFDRWFREGCE